MKLLHHYPYSSILEEHRLWESKAYQELLDSAEFFGAYLLIDLLEESGKVIKNEWGTPIGVHQCAIILDRHRFHELSRLDKHSMLSNCIE